MGKQQQQQQQQQQQPCAGRDVLLKDTMSRPRPGAPLLPCPALCVCVYVRVCACTKPFADNNNNYTTKQRRRSQPNNHNACERDNDERDEMNHEGHTHK